MKYTLIITLWVFLLFSCTSNKDELPQPKSNNETSNENSTPIITYTNHAKKILDTKCTTCHSPTPIDFQQSPFLTTYVEVEAKKDRIQIRALDQGSMPLSISSTGLLTIAEKDTLQMWLDQGALE